MSKTTSPTSPKGVKATSKNMDGQNWKLLEWSLSEPNSYKNRLQEFAQRSRIAIPMYQTANEGSDHAPMFRATVWVNGMGYTSQNTFSQRKSAEQDVARVALECQSVQIKNEGCFLVYENTHFSKSILNEYVAKMKMERPTY